jgi:Tol biopolymer transport system component
MVAGLLASCLAASSLLAQQASIAESIQIVASGARVHWASTGLIAFDRIGADGLYDLFTMTGTEERCFTCASFPGHTGNPAWHPSGLFMVFQVHDTSLALPPEYEGRENKLTSPGWGVNNNLWITNRNGSAYWPLTQVQSGGGTLHPHFTPDGGRVLWAEKIGSGGVWGQWTMRLADLIWEAGTPHLRNIVEFAPLGTDVFYETHGVTQDERILFSASLPHGSPMDVYSYEMASGGLANLSDTPDVWDEHAQITPDGSKIYWISSQDVPLQRDYFVPYTDVWRMNPDGSNQERVTYFNDPNAPEYYPSGMVTGDISFEAGGGRFVVKLEITNPNPPAGQRTFVERVALITLR